MRGIFILLMLLPVRAIYAQPGNSINFNYWYNPQNEVLFNLNPVIQGDSIAVFYQLNNQTPAPSSYILQWERKDSYSQRQGSTLAVDTLKLISGYAGKLLFSKSQKPWLLGARITNISTGKNWYFVKQIEAHYPVNGFLEKDGSKIFLPYRTAAEKYVVHGSGSGKPIHFSYYRDNFPTPSPPFAEKEVKLDRFLFPDSTFSILPGKEVGPFSAEGLYLAQEDTLSSHGFSFLVKNDPYPKYNTLRELKGPLLFVTTREENDQLGAAGEDKAKFDKVILAITKDKDRAKNFMRNYFRRVEYANHYFTSYKEGWKTDRGMIFIVFGPPDEVTVDGQHEIWGYKNPRQQFSFYKVGSVYHPEHFVLIRNPDYTEAWYMTIDMWRKSRF